MSGTKSTKELIMAYKETDGEEESSLPLSDAQKQLWILDRLEPESAMAYNQSINVEMRGPLRLDAMKRALKKVVDRHEALRTRIGRSGEKQQICRPQEIELPILDFSNQEGSYNFTQAQNWFEKENRKSFDLNAGPPWRMQVLKLEEQLHWLVFSAHHIGLDFQSMFSILQELGVLYSAECKGETCQLQEPKQFQEYINWLENQTQTGQMAEHEAYWLNQLAGELPGLNLPTDWNRPGKRDYKINKESIELKDCIIKEDNKTIALAAYIVFLHKLTGQSDLIVGVPTSGRYFPGSEELVGCCGELLPIRSVLESNAITFSDYLKQIEKVYLEAKTHQNYPFARLSLRLNSQNNSTNSRLITTLFGWQKSVMAPKMWELETALEPQPLDFKDYDLYGKIVESENHQLTFEINYSTQLLAASTIKRWLRHFQTLLEAILENPDRQIWELPLLSQEDNHKLLVEWNDTEEEYPADKCIHQLFEEQVRQRPDAVAVVLGNDRLTYSELNHRSNQVARYLETLGVGPEVLVGICVERSWEAIVGILGILKAGGAYVPLDPSYPQERLAYMLNDSGLKVLLTQEKLLNSFSEYPHRTVCLDAEWGAIEQYSKENKESEVKPNNLAYVIYTSGSTGKPKGVLSAHQGLCNLASALQKRFDVRPGDRFLQFAPLSFDSSVAEIFATLASGAGLVLGTKESLLLGPNFLQLLREQKVTHTVIGPAALAVLPPEELPSLKVLIVAGEAVSSEVFAKWSPGRRFFNAYGPSEATVCATIAEVTDAVEKPPIGSPIANVKVHILDEYLQPVPIGVPGELHIGGSGLARGYLNRQELTQKKFVPNPFGDGKGSRLYKSGDLARYRPDGQIEFIGRIDHQVKVRGYRIELGEIEALLSRNPQVREAVVIQREDEPGDRRLVAYVVPEEDKPEPAFVKKLGEYTRKQMPEYMVPAAFVVMQNLPLTPNNKVNRKALPPPDTSGRAIADYVKPNSGMEKNIAKVWQDVLKIEKVGIYDNFFELGGNSLLLVKVYNQLQQIESLSQKPSMVELFKYPTISALAKQMSGKIKDSPGAIAYGEARGAARGAMQQQRQLRRRHRSRRQKP